MNIPFSVKQEDKTIRQTNEYIAVGLEYEAIGKMIHEALGESRIAHAIQTGEFKWETNPDVDKVKKTADEFLNKVFQEYTKERLLRFSIFFLSKLFFSLYLTLASITIIFILLLENIITFDKVLVILLLLLVISIIILFLVNESKEKLYKNSIC